MAKLSFAGSVGSEKFTPDKMSYFIGPWAEVSISGSEENIESRQIQPSYLPDTLFGYFWIKK